ncbi:MAG: peroxiredoxin [Marinobacterium sp.]|nr:peroxiredoxin [Marinobacterium sp.]
MIQVGDSIPAVNLTAIIGDEQYSDTADKLFTGKKVVLFAVPGAFTPTCSSAHLPGFVVKADEIQAKGVDMIACLSVNDAFVMKAWAQAQNAEQITMLADGGAAFTEALGLSMATGDFGGTRSQRFAMIIDNGQVTQLNVEAPKTFEVSSAEAMLALL